jgi:DNA modification methylase
MKERLRQLQNIDWEFSDYRGFSSFPADINSLHWYPAPFVPQIPAILIQSLTERGDTVLDTFAGTGVALIEAARLKRKFIGIDLNPYVVNITKAKFYAMSLADKEWFLKIKEDLKSLSIVNFSIEDYCREFGIDKEVFKWFEKKTLRELCSLHQYVRSESNNKNKLLKKVLFSSILQRCCSQREHYTYVTDRCYPKKLLYVNAPDFFLKRAELIAIAAERFRKQYKMMYEQEWRFSEGIISIGDVRSLKFLKDKSVEIVITSPPYLGVNDYVRSMRLTWLFFPEKETEKAMKDEIGARRKRHRKYAYEEYINNMNKSFSEISRVLKFPGFLCLVIGQSRGRVCKRNVVEDLLEILQDKYEFKIGMKISRKIKFRRIQVPGVGNEEIIILNRKLG